MKVKYASTWLAPGGVERARDITLNGSQVVEVQQLFRAAAVRPVARGNKADTFTFTVTQLKDSVRFAERASLSQLADIPGSGQLEVVCGDTGDEQSFFNQAALQSVDRSYVGRSLVLRYTFVCGLWTESGSTIISEEGDVIRGKVSLAASDTTKAVTFLASLGAPPTVVQAWIVPPDGGDFIDCRPVKSTITADGFTAAIASAIPASGYDLHWTVVK